MTQLPSKLNFITVVFCATKSVDMICWCLFLWNIKHVVTMDTAVKLNVSLAMCEPFTTKILCGIWQTILKKNCTHYHLQNSETLVNVFLTLGLLLSPFHLLHVLHQVLELNTLRSITMQLPGPILVQDTIYDP